LGRKADQLDDAQHPNARIVGTEIEVEVEAETEAGVRVSVRDWGTFIV